MRTAAGGFSPHSASTICSAGHDPAGVQREHSQERTQLRARDHDVPLVVIEHFESTQQPDAHTPDGTAAAARPFQRHVSFGSAARRNLAA